MSRWVKLGTLAPGQAFVWKAKVGFVVGQAPRGQTDVRWLGMALQGNLGYRAVGGQPVSDVVGRGLKNSLVLMGTASAFAAMLCIASNAPAAKSGTATNTARPARRWSALRRAWIDQCWKNTNAIHKAAVIPWAWSAKAACGRS